MPVPERKDRSPWSRDPVPPPDPKRDRPKTIGEAREHIRQAYEKNGWDAAEQSRYETRNVGLDPRPLSERDASDIRKILERMERTRMLLYKPEDEECLSTNA